MGCSVGKLDSRKLQDESVIGAMQIQTVLQLKASDNKSLKDVKQTSKTTRSRRHKRDDSNNKKKGEARHKSPRTKSEKTIKPINDANTTAKTNKPATEANTTTKTIKPVYDINIVAKYDIKAVIGKGSFSRVLRVEHRQTKQPYALKIIEAQGGREAFDAEHSVLRRLNHPNVIRLIEVYESDNKVYMVMELATGGSLLDRLEARGYLTEDDSRDVLRMVLQGVHYLHGLGITHRDLKPDNLLYYHPGKESKLMIADFSFASSRRKASNPFMHTVCGTPQYIAPEIVTRKPYTCSVDMWAIGVITYIVLCGVFPFDAEHDAQIFKLILKGEVDMSNSTWRDLSEESKLFVHELLQTDPVHRLSADVALQHKWLTSSKLTFSPPRKQTRQKSDRRSLRSSRSVGSSKSGGSVHSLRVSGHRRVQIQHLEALSSDPEVAAMM